MRKEVVERYVYTKDEIRALLIEDLASRGIETEGESALFLSGMTVVLEIWLPRMDQGETSGQGEGESKGKNVSRQDSRRAWWKPTV